MTNLEKYGFPLAELPSEADLRKIFLARHELFEEFGTTAMTLAEYDEKEIRLMEPFERYLKVFTIDEFYREFEDKASRMSVYASVYRQVAGGMGLPSLELVIKLYFSAFDSEYVCIPVINIVNFESVFQRDKQLIIEFYNRVMVEISRLEFGNPRKSFKAGVGVPVRSSRGGAAGLSRKAGAKARERY